MVAKNQLSLEGICSIELATTWKKRGRVLRLVLSNKGKSIDLLQQVPGGWRIVIGYGPSVDINRREVNISELPDYEANQGFPQAAEHRKYLTSVWLAETLHEIGHMQDLESLLSRANGELPKRKKGDTKSFELRAASQILENEMDAWEYALKKVEELELDSKTKRQVKDRITGACLRGYIQGALDPFIRRYDRETFERGVEELYQAWLDKVMPEQQFNFRLARQMKRERLHPYMHIREKLQKRKTVAVQLREASEENIKRILRPIPNGKDRVQIVQKREESQAEYTYIVANWGELYNGTPQEQRLERHISMADITSCTLLNSTKTDAGLEFSIPRLTGYRGIIIP